MDTVLRRVNKNNLLNLAFTCCLLLVLCPYSSVNAGPVINSIDFGAGGSHGDIVSVYGEGFGGGEKAIPMLWDTIDNQNAYEGLSDGELVPVGPEYVYEARSRVQIDRQEARQRHARSLAQYHSPGDNAWIGNAVDAGGSSPPVSVTELFISYWIKYDRQVYEMENHASHKFFRCWVADGKDLRISWTQKHLTCSNANAGSDSSKVVYPNDNPNWSNLHKADTWHHHEAWISAEEGIIRTYVDGFLVMDWDDQDDRYLKTDHPEGLRFSLFGWNPAAGTEHVNNAKFEMSDIAISQSRARVLLSSSPTWPDPSGDTFRSDHEYQPVISWSEDEIEFEINKGALEGDEMFLYVVDSEGNLNEKGFPVLPIVQNINVIE